ncbi:MAG: CdaR family protein [Clostridium sp.]|nr:CdaR family protein [Clostridium sp.]MCM1172915.1 CdaR family protein [Clostridium sp.]MCM1208595.1 CdaR family protein [Ruminococcus sp.]
MKKKLLNNIGLKIISVVLAVVFWFAVMNVSDYTMTIRIENIPVQQLNGEVLEELDQVYDVASGDTVDIIVKGRRSVVSKLGKEDFVATADLSTMSITNTVQIFVTPKSNSLADEISISYVDNTMKLNLEDKVVTQFPIKVKQEGETASGYAVGEIEVKPNIINVEGPKSAVDKITEVRATVSVSGFSASCERETTIGLYDAYGEPIHNDKLSVSQASVKLNISVYPVKSVAVNVSTIGTAGTGYDVAQVVYQPQTIQIAGPQEKIDRITAIQINDLSISGLTEDFETTINVEDYLPEDVFVVGENKDIAVSVTIEKLENITYDLNVRDVTLAGRNNKYTYEIVLSDGYKVTASGLEDVMDGLDLSAIKPSIDCGSLSVGTNNNVTLELKELDGITYETSGTITVIVKEK